MKAPCLATMLGAVLLVMTTFAYAEDLVAGSPAPRVGLRRRSAIFSAASDAAVREVYSASSRMLIVEVTSSTQAN